MADEIDKTIDELSQLSIHSTTNTKELDPNWLIPHPNKRGFHFQCSLSLKELVNQNLVELYFRKLLSIVEDDQNIVDFHMVLHLEERTHLTVDFMYKSHQNRSGPVPTDICISCDTENPLSKFSLLEDNPKTRIWLDGQLREKFIVTPVKHIERLSDMNQEEMKAFWIDTQSFLDKQGCAWQSIVVNHGIYRNHAHLHMKINIHPRTWEHRIKGKYKDKLRQMDQLLNHSGENATEKYFGHRQFNQWSGIQKSGSKNT